MFGGSTAGVEQLRTATGAIPERLHRLEQQHARLQGRILGNRALEIFTTSVAVAAQAAPIPGAAIEGFAQAMRAPLPSAPRGGAGGIARNPQAWRYNDGTLVPESEKLEAGRCQYERYARGGRARAASAVRDERGRFIDAEDRFA